MRITIKNKNTKAVIITFRTKKEKFESNYERIKFFKELHGWNQTIPRDGKKYKYRRNGILDEIPHMRLANSVFAISNEHIKKMQKFFDEWNKKVDYDKMEITIKRKFLQVKNLNKKCN